ncbi:TetR/AcrR family transcriptional regulator [Arthrobacter roseus]|uniref:TetR/AcrR family transcriptional regulator n=1 Tax=Arthrobacter roseus TaxID=136274 RepID=UPI001964A78D|nr:TetR/AcrR family transcriptional regulator [Arthrobacter roseus]MBM7847815.1 AcrR family transcriptional regulator [Arthrobacter roseus]
MSFQEPESAEQGASESREPEGPEAPLLDGRSARALRTRRTISDAHLALINDGELRPSARQVTERAGVSQRTLWDNFKDMESVMAETAARQLAEQDAALVPIDAGLALAERIELYCAQRGNVLEAVAPMARAADVHRPFSPVLQRNLESNLERIRAEIERLFEPELSLLDEDRRNRITLALCTASDWANWQLLRAYLGQSAEEARRALEVSVGALLVRSCSPNVVDHEKRKSS